LNPAEQDHAAEIYARASSICIEVDGLTSAAGGRKRARHRLCWSRWPFAKDRAKTIVWAGRAITPPVANGCSGQNRTFALLERDVVIWSATDRRRLGEDPRTMAGNGCKPSGGFARL